MEQKDKELLLKDLYARLFCKVIVHIRYNTGQPCYGELTSIDLKWFIDSKIKEIKPYLRPMSSMTEEEKEEFAEVTGGNCSFIDAHGNFFIDFGEFICEGSPVSLSRIVYVTNWLYAHHFDVNNLIPKGLALKAPKDMYNRI